MLLLTGGALEAAGPPSEWRGNAGLRGRGAEAVGSTEMYSCGVPMGKCIVAAEGL